MAKTLGQALAARIRCQVKDGEAVLNAGGYGTKNDRTCAVFGSAQDVLTVRGNIADVALTNHLWLLDLAASGAAHVELTGELKKARPASIPEAIAFLAPRESASAAQALARLQSTNEALAAAIEGLSDEELERPVNMTFKGPVPVRDLAFTVIEHGALHIGQAWGILKGCGKV